MTSSSCSGSPTLRSPPRAASPAAGQGQPPRAADEATGRAAARLDGRRREGEAALGVARPRSPLAPPVPPAHGGLAAEGSYPSLLRRIRSDGELANLSTRWRQAELCCATLEQAEAIATLARNGITMARWAEGLARELVALNDLSAQAQRAQDRLARQLRLCRRRDEQLARQISQLHAKGSSSDQSAGETS